MNLKYMNTKKLIYKSNKIASFCNRWQTKVRLAEKDTVNCN